MSGAPEPWQRPWTEAEIERVGTGTDREIGRLLGRTEAAVRQYRYRRGIPSFRPRRDVDRKPRVGGESARIMDGSPADPPPPTA